MGMWGADAFANDSAADWLDELEEGGWAQVLSTLEEGEDLSAPADYDWLMIPVAAGEVVANLAGRPGAAETVRKLAPETGRRPQVPAEEVNAALPQAARVIRAIWTELGAIPEEETGPAFAEWRAAIGDLATRLEEAAAGAARAR